MAFISTEVSHASALFHCDQKRTPLEVDFTQRGPHVDQIHSGKDDNLKDVRFSPHRQEITPLAGMHGDEKPMQILECLQEWKVIEEINDYHEENANYLATYTHLAGGRLSNINLEEEDSFYEADCNNICSRSELYPSSHPQYLEKDTDFEQGGGAKIIDGLMSNDTVPTENSQREKADDNRLDASCNMGSLETNTTCSDGDNKDQHCSLNEQTSLESFGGHMHIVGHKNNFISSSYSNPLMEQMQGNVLNGNQEAELGPQENSSLEQDHAVALWTKWRGKWQTGIRCPRADCPLSLLRAKPTHERKRYIPVFFPCTRTYTWADMLRVHSISELPEPLVCGTHCRWRKMVKDLTLPRQHIMQKLAVVMLEIGGRLHTEAVIENARKATAWKEFAMEASQCRDYIDLGRMLLKLHNMILPCYVSCSWLENSFGSWKSKCQNAQSAVSSEILTVELMNSILWMEVDELWNAQVQPQVGLDWKTWKQEAMRLFFSSHSTAIVGEMEPSNGINSLVMGYQTSSKRPKLELRQGETCVSQMEAPTFKILSQINMMETDLRCFTSQEILESTSPYQPCKVEELSMVVGTSESHTSANRCNEFVDESKDMKLIEVPEVGAETNIERGNMVILNAQNESDATKRYQQCLAFVPSKGRQCGRWANDGEIYCCAHLNACYAEKLSQEAQKPPLEAPMCEGTTTHGRKCKYHARHGSTFCKKHQLLRCHDSMYSNNRSSGNAIMRNSTENPVLKSFSSSNIVCDEPVSPKEIQTTDENLIQVVVGQILDERNCLMKKSELYNALPVLVRSPDLPHCVGNYRQNNGSQCLKCAKRHTLYCEKHLPKFLKRARNGRCRLLSKDIFLNLLENCNSRKEKLCLHKACELLYGFMRNGLSRQRPVSKGDTMAWILSEAIKDLAVGDCLLKLVSSEKEKLSRIGGLNINKDGQQSSLETKVTLIPMVNNKAKYPEVNVKCKICAEELSDDHKLAIHWIEVHKKEARWLFRGYACAVCMSSFTNRKVLETHVKERHGAQFLEHSIIFRCMSCNSHFVNSEQLWQHILSSHSMDFRLLDLTLQSQYQSVEPKILMSNELSCSNNVPERHGDLQKLTCSGLRFDLPPDLGCHHQVAHVNQNSISQFPPKRGSYHLKCNGHRCSRLKKHFDASYRFKNQMSFDMQKPIKSSHSVLSVKELQSQAFEPLRLGQLLDVHCLGVAETLFSKIQKTKPRPSNFEILSIVRSACCRTSFFASLEVKYGNLPENVYLKALKLCSELNIRIDWHLEGFICPKGCKPLAKPHCLVPLNAIKQRLGETPAHVMDPSSNANWEMDESHYILNLDHLNCKPIRKAIILCEDVSFGREPVPVACVVDEDFKDTFLTTSCEGSYSEEPCVPLPWQAFDYVTKRLIEPSLCLEAKDLQLGCKCPDSKCNPENCDHVYLFDDDHMNAKDVTGNSMHGRFAYDEKGMITLEEGYPVYECNSMCKCDETCPNRVLQKGVQVKLEIFRTEKKGWAVRAGEVISRGTFVCEYIGEILNEANRREERYDSDGCSYLYDIDAHIDGARHLLEGMVGYVIDATKYGNIARFINHSCSPNLINYLVLVENMDCQLAHIGLYASRDIAIGEELAYDYCSKLVPGEGRPCHCGASNCRGRLY